MQKKRRVKDSFFGDQMSNFILTFNLVKKDEYKSNCIHRN